MAKKKIISYLVLGTLVLLSACSPKYQMTEQSDIDALTKSASFEMPQVTVPEFPSRTFNVLDFGADPTGVQLATEAIQKAIDECTAAGGGTVIIPAGIYTTAPITLKSNVRLFTEKNCFVQFTHDLDQYEIMDDWFEGIPTKRCTSPLNALNAENIAITGYGTFNGNGDWWRPLKRSKMAPAQWKKHLQEKGGIVVNDIWYPDEASVYAQSLCVDQNVPVVEDENVWPQIKSVKTSCWRALRLRTRRHGTSIPCAARTSLCIMSPCATPGTARTATAWMWRVAKTW